MGAVLMGLGGGANGKGAVLPPADTCRELEDEAVVDCSWKLRAPAPARWLEMAVG